MGVATLALADTQPLGPAQLGGTASDKVLMDALALSIPLTFSRASAKKTPPFKCSYRFGRRERARKLH